MVTQAEMNEQLELLSERVNELIYIPAEEQLQPLDEIVEELSALQKELKKLLSKNPVAVKVIIKKLTAYEKLQSTVAEYIKNNDIPAITLANGITRVNKDEVMYDLYPGEILITGSWGDMNSAVKPFELDDLACLGQLEFMS